MSRSLSPLLILIVLFLSACTPTETIIRQEEIKVPVPVIADTVYVVMGLDTTWVEGLKIVEHDTVIQVKYFPVEKKFYIKVKPDTVTITHTDTMNVTRVEVEETPFLSKVGLVGIGVGLAVIGLITLKLKGLLPI